MHWLIIVHNLQLKVAHYDYRDFLCLGVCPFAFGYMVVSVVITHKVFQINFHEILESISKLVQKYSLLDWERILTFLWVKQ